MARRSVAALDRVEMIDAALEEDDDRPVVRTPWWSWLALAVAVGAVLTLVADRRSGEEAPVHAPAPSGLGIFDLDEVGLAAALPRSAVTFPLFDRDWDVDLVVVQGHNVVAVDLNTGEPRVVTALEGDAALAPFLDGMRSADGAILLLESRGGIVNVDGTSITIVAPDEESTQRSFLLGTGHLATARFPHVGTPELYVSSILTGRPVDARPPIRFAGTADDLLVERAESIVLVDQHSERSFWASGQILLAGDGAAVWRTCPGNAACVAWAGDRTDPKALAIDTNAALAVVAARAAIPDPLRTDLAAPNALAPDGRLAWYDTVETDGFGRLRNTGIELVDLGDGRAVRLPGTGTSPVFTPDSSALVTTAGGVPTVFDLRTGEAARIRLITTAGVLRQNAATFLSPDELAQAG